MTAKEREMEAKATVALYNKLYPNLIQKSINGTEVYRENSSFQKLIQPLKKRVENLISFEMIVTEGNKAVNIVLSTSEYKDKKIAILNGGNYKNAGGQFLHGGCSLEADLCKESFLYNVLSAFDKEYYIPNQRKINKSLFTNAAIYTPDIHFFLTHDEKDIPPRTNIDVITCSPPNMSSFLRKRKETGDYNYSEFDTYEKVIQSRFNFIKKICELNDIEILIIENWGCNRIYQGRSYILSKYFRSIFNISSTISKVIFTATPNPLDSFAYHRMIKSIIDLQNQIKINNRFTESKE